MTDVVMPQLGETVTEGTITKWFKQVGDTIAEDEILFEVSTDKVDSEVPSPLAGVISEILVAEGDTVEVGTVLARLGGADEAPAVAPSVDAAAATAEPEPSPVAATPASELPPPPPPSVPDEPAPTEAAPAAAALPPPPPPAVEVAKLATGNGDAKLLSPVVRRLLSDHDLDANTITGTGLGGRITRADVETAIHAQGPAPAPQPEQASAPVDGAAAPEAPVAPTEPAPAPVESAPTDEPVESAPAVVSGPIPMPAADSVVALSNIRTITGEHMVMSKATSPHVLTSIEVDFEGVEKVRLAHRKQWKSDEGFSLTYLPFIVRAVADAIEEFPHINASMGDGELIVHGSLHMAIAVDLNFEGLLAPVVRSAETKRLRAISREIVDLATRARAKKLNADEISGGTFTITNPGQYGTMMQFPIINQPQVAILSTDGIKRKPVAVKDADGNEAIAVHSVGVLALAWDHRAFDGAYVAAFLHRLQTIIETRDWETEI